MNIIDKPISELTPYENNPRNNDNAVGAVANSIEAFHASHTGDDTRLIV